MPTTGPIYRVGAQFTEQLNYSNPLHRPVETVWYRYEMYFLLATDYRVVFVDPPQVPVEEYLFRYGTPSSPGALVPDQYPVMSLIPGSYHYQPIAEEVWVFVPQDYTPNHLKSQQDVLLSNYPIVHSRKYFVRPIL